MATQTYVTDLQAMNPSAVTIQQKPTTTQSNVSAQQQPQTVQIQKSSSAATIIQPAQAHSGQQQQQTQNQATSLLQPAQAHSGQQFIVATVGDPNGEQNQSQQEAVTLQQGQTVYSHVQQTYHEYGQTMYTPVSGTYYQVTPGSQLSGNINQGGTIQAVQGQLLQGGTYLIQGGTMDGEGTPLSHTTRASPVTVGFDSPAQVGCDLMENHANVQWLFDNYETAEGVSLPRSTLYNHYLRHCQEENLDPMNPASFGKLIRSVFLGLRTRRLGTRGNSKYHYYGIRIKANSPLNQFTDDQTMAMRQQPMYQGKKFRPKLEDGSHGSVHTPGPFDGPTTQQQQHQQFLGDASGAIPNFGEVEITEVPLPEGVAAEHVRTFERMYREHSEAIVDVVVNLQFSLIEALWQGFWRTHSEQSMDSDYEKRLSKEKLFAICQYDPVHQWVRKADYAFYQALVEVLIPDVLRPIPSSLTQAIRNFAKSLENWLKGAMLNVPEEMVKTKIGAVSAFAQTLRRYTSLNHLAQAARAVLQNTSQINQMLTDLNRVDFANVQEQASWVCQCEDGMVHQLEQDFKKTLQQQNSLEQWAVWLEGVVNQVLKSHEGNPNFPKAARQFLLKWSFYSSMVIRDLTLRSAASFGSFHLIRLLYDEYMFYLVEHKVAASTGETPIAVMGEFIDLSSAVAMGTLDADPGSKSTLKKTNTASLLNPLPTKTTMSVGNIVSTKSVTSNVLSTAVKSVPSGVPVNTALNNIGNLSTTSSQYTTISANVLNTIKNTPNSISANNIGQSSALHSSNAITTNALTSATKITLSGVNANTALNTVGNISSIQSSNSSVSGGVHGATTKYTGIAANQASSILGNVTGSQPSNTAISNVQSTPTKYTLSGINKTAINSLSVNPACNTTISANVLNSATKHTLSGITANTQLGNLSTASSNTTTVMVLAPQSVSSVNTNGIPSRANTPTLSNPTTFTLRNTGNTSLTGTKTIVVMPASSVAGSGDGVSPLKKIKADL